MKLIKQLLTLGVALVIALGVAACGSDDSDSDSASGTDTETSNAGSDAGGTDGGEIVFAHSASIAQVVKLPQTLAIEAMGEQGYEVSQDYMQTTTDSINAVLRGTATFGNTAPANFFSAVSEGADIVAIAGGGRPDYALLGNSGLGDICNAERLAVNNPVSTTDVLVKISTAACDDEKEILTIALTPNRINAMTGGQIDATPVQLSSVPLVEREYSGTIDVMNNWAEEYAEIVSTMTFVKRSTLEERPAALRDYVAAQQQVIEDMYADPSVLVDATERLVDTVAPEDAEAAAMNYIDSEVFPLDGGLNADQLQATVEQLQEAGTVTGDVDPEQYVDRRFVDEVIGGEAAEADE